jgi:hypothetical protein
MSNTFFQALKNLPEQKLVDLEYRLYYDPESGEPLFYTSTDEPGTYIVVDKTTYNVGNYHCVVKNGKIVNLNIVGEYRKLVPSDTGVVTHTDNVMIITQTGQHWAIKTYEN